MRKKEGNKEKDIIDAAIIEFANTGFYGAKISKIAEIANVSIGSVYVYYKSKDDILYKIFENLWGSIYENFKTLTSQKDLSVIDKYDAMIDLIFDAFTENSNIAKVIAHEQERLISREKFTPYYEEFIKLGEKIVKEGIKKGIFNYSINVNIFRHYMLGALRDLINSWAINPKEYPLNTIRQNVKYLTKHGLLKH